LPTGEAFSANFATEELLKQFCKNVMVTAAHVARYTSVELAETLLQVTAPDTSSGVTEPGDTCGVVYAVWDLPSGPSLAPNAGLALAPASDNGGEIIKLKAGDTKGEPVQVSQYLHIYMLCKYDTIIFMGHMFVVGVSSVVFEKTEQENPN
jgi:hypothetical protein